MKAFILALTIAALTNKTMELETTLGVGLLLADETLVGKVQNIESTEPDNPWADYRIVLLVDGVEKELYLSDPENRFIQFSDKTTKVVLTSELETSDIPFVLGSPEIAIYSTDSVDPERIAELTEKARNAAQEFMRSTGDCSADYMSLIRQLDGSKQQSAIDSLFESRPLSPENFKCLVSAIRSTDRLSESSFSPPYSNWEEVFHHGYPTRGDLVAHLLQHLAGVSIYPISLPMSDRQRHQLVDAWAYWGDMELAKVSSAGKCGDHPPVN